MKKHISIFTLSICFFLFINNTVKAQAIDPTYESIFMYQFTRYITWPSSEGQFVIGVLGETPVRAALDKMASTKKVNGKRRIVILTFPEVANIKNCHMIFIPSGQRSKIGAVSAKLKGKPVVIVSESKGLALKGAHINFFTKSSKVKFEMNLATMKASKLEVTGRFKDLAVIVK